MSEVAPGLAGRRRVVVSGGTSGIGLAVARRLAATSDVWVIGSRPESVAAALAEVPSLRGSVADVADEDAVTAAVDAAAGAFGGLDAAFVNAGIDGQAVAADRIGTAGFRRLLDVNVVGAFLVARAALAHFAGPATILFNASLNGVRPEANFADYNASKAAVISLAKTFALELGPRQIASIALAPGYYRTAMTAPYLDDPQVAAELLTRIPLGRFGDTAQLAELVDVLLSPAGQALTGSVVTPDGGAGI